MIFTSVTPMTFTDPEKLNKNELIALCKEYQDTIRCQDAALSASVSMLAKTNSSAFAVVSQLGALVDAFDENDNAAIETQLRMMSDQRKSFKKPEVH